MIAKALTAAVGIGGLFVSFRQATDRHAAFFGTAKQFPTSGGEKTKPEW